MTGPVSSSGPVSTPVQTPASTHTPAPPSTAFTADVVIGLEIHVELGTKTKLFCGCSRISTVVSDSGSGGKSNDRPGSESEEMSDDGDQGRFGEGDELPNTRTCPTCLGHPGSKPVLNKQVVEYALRLCSALGCGIAPQLVFSRKSYFYPDLAKNYQITQYEIPLGEGGEVVLSTGQRVALTRIHIEEDPASLIHPGGMQGSSYVLVDYNRSGNPLLEIVTEPQMGSPDEARDFMKQLVTVLKYLGIYDGGVIKADANVSIKETGYVRAEIKNITGFKEIERALVYEIDRQKRECSSGNVVQETRAWDSEKGMTFSLRKKETEEDYGYIIDPNLVPIDITDSWVSDVQQNMPELAQDKVKRYVADVGVSEDDAIIICSEPELAYLFEEIVKLGSSVGVDGALASRWMRKELLRVLNYNKMNVSDLNITAEHIVDLLKLISEKKVSDKIARELIEKMVDSSSPFLASEYVRKEDLEAVNDSGELEAWCKQAINENPQAVSEYKSGKDIAVNFLVGQVMKMSRGKADAKVVKEVLLGLL